MFRLFSGYMGDLTVALEPPQHLRLASDDSLQSGEYFQHVLVEYLLNNIIFIVSFS